MRYIVEGSLYDFNAWAGGEDTLDDLRALDVVDNAEEYINMIMDCREELPTQKEINDILWFERDDIYKYCGIYNEVYDITEEEDDEEEE